MEENFNQENAPSPMMEYKRPSMLVVLCILTFISSGMNCLSYLLMPYIIPYLPEYISQVSMPTDLYAMVEELTLIPSWKFIFLALCCAGSVVGAALLLKLKTVGFHVYAISKLLNILIAYFMLAGTSMKASGMSIITTVLIVALYFIYYYQMKKTEELNNLRNNNDAERGF